MASFKTLFTNIRSATQQAHNTWVLVDQQVNSQKLDALAAGARASTELKDALSITFSDKGLASCYREMVKTKYPQYATITSGFKLEVEKLTASIRDTSEDDIRKHVAESQRLYTQMVEDTRKSTPAMYNNLSALDGLIRESHKTGFETPNESPEADPGQWLIFLENLDNKLHESLDKSNWMPLFGAGKNALAKEAKLIEKRSKEGWPTILLHAKQSLALQQRLVRLQDQYKNVIDLELTKLAEFRSQTARLEELKEMGEEGYVLARADSNAVVAFAQCLDTAVVGNAVMQAWSVFEKINKHSTNLNYVSEILVDWRDNLQKLHRKLEDVDKNAKEEDIAKLESYYAAMHDACTCIRRACSLVHQWIEALLASKVKSTGITDGIYTDGHIRNLMNQSNIIVENAVKGPAF